MSTLRLHPDTIEEVKQRVDIVEVVADQVVLKKRGKDFVGLCPFHEDRSPSFTVSPAKQFYYCFSCGAGGNVFKFLTELNKVSFGEAVLQLAQRYQVPIKTLEPEQRLELERQISLREQLYEVMALAMRFYQHALLQPVVGEAALHYLRHQRQFQDDIIQRFQLGYAPPGWTSLYHYLVEQKHYPAPLVVEAGLIVSRQSGAGYYDRFRDRLMIPIHDLQGRVIGFGGRTLSGDEPKYLNSPETPLFDKGKTLFALDKARGAIAQRDQVVVVEGYFDVIALHAVGITHGVAALGTALSLPQIKQLLRYTESKQIILNFDADKAGSRATNRAIGEVEDLAYRGEVQLRVLNLPVGKDADEFLRSHGANAYQRLLDQAPLWIDWQLQQLLLGRDLKQGDQFQQTVQGMVALLGRLPNASLRTHYIHHCAELLSQGSGRLTLQLELDLRTQVRGQRWHGRSQKWERPTDFTLREAAEAQLLRIYLHCPGERSKVRGAMEERDLEFSWSHHRLLWRAILDLEEKAECNTLPVESLDLVTALLQTDVLSDLKQVFHLLELSDLTQIDILRPTLVIRTAVASLERIMCEKRCRHFLAMWEEASRAAQQQPLPLEKLRELNREVARLEQLFQTEERYMQEMGQALGEVFRPGDNPETDPPDPGEPSEAYRLQQMFYAEKRYLQTLLRQQYVSTGELI